MTHNTKYSLITRHAAEENEKYFKVYNLRGL